MELQELIFKLIFLLFSTLALVALILAMIATSTDLHLPALISNLVPDRGNGMLQDGIKCYGLPYGGIGFLSHILTYCTIFSLNLACSPLKLISKLCCCSGGTELNRPWIDFTLALISLVLTVASSALSMVRCRDQWPLVLIATWKMLLSLSLGFTAVHRALDVRRVNQGPDTVTRKHLFRPNETVEQSRTPRARPACWILLYAAGIIIGLVGLIAIVTQTWHTHTKAMLVINVVFGAFTIPTGIFGGVVGFVAGGGAVHPFIGCTIGLFGATVGCLSAIGVLAALYSDWILAAIEVQKGGNWTGLPAVNARWLYWTYFVAKRLPTFSV